MERRWGERLLINRNVWVRVPGRPECASCLHDVSLSGAFLAGMPQMPYMTRVWLEVSLPEEEDASCWHEHLIEAFVTRPASEGVGLEWCDFAHPCAVRMMQWLQREGAREVELAPEAQWPRARAS